MLSHDCSKSKRCPVLELRAWVLQFKMRAKPTPAYTLTLHFPPDIIAHFHNNKKVGSQSLRVVLVS